MEPCKDLEQGKVCLVRAGVLSMYRCTPRDGVGVRGSVGVWASVGDDDGSDGSG